MCSHYFTPSLCGVHTCCHLLSLHIVVQSQIINLVLRGKTPRARTYPKVANVGYKDPITHQKLTLFRGQDLLLWIVSWICKNTRKQAPLNGVWTHYNDSMLVRLNKFLVKYFLPLAMKKFPMTVCKESITRPLIFEMIEHEILEVVRKLRGISVNNHLPVQ